MQIQKEFNINDIIQKLGKNSYKKRIDDIDGITKKEAIVNNILFILDEQKRTASVFRNYSFTNDVLIPQEIIYQHKKYTINQFNDYITGFQYTKCIKFANNSEIHEINKNLLANTNLEEIFIPSNVRKICECAFHQCYKLRKVIFQKNSKLLIIEKDAFYLSSLESISIPSSIEELQEGWCRGTWLLKDVSINHNNNQLYSNYDGGLIIGKSDRNIQNNDTLLFVPRNIVELTIPPFIRKIDSYSFSFSTIKSIKIPPQVKIINKSAFSNCCYLQKVEFFEKSDLEIINDEAFFYSSLTNISIPSSVSFIGDSTFGQCKKLKKILFPNDSKLSVIGNYAFSESSLESISIPSSVKRIGKFAFSSCDNLMIIEFGKNIETLMTNQFLDEDTFYNSLNVVIMCPSIINCS